MTTREAIAIVRDYKPLNDTGEWAYLLEAMRIVAAIVEHHADRNRKNKRRQRQRITDFAPGGATASASKTTGSESPDRDGAGAVNS